jgi:hypothetical protein
MENRRAENLLDVLGGPGCCMGPFGDGEAGRMGVGVVGRVTVDGARARRPSREPEGAKTETGAGVAFFLGDVNALNMDHSDSY